MSLTNVSGCGERQSMPKSCACRGIRRCAVCKHLARSAFPPEAQLVFADARRFGDLRAATNPSSGDGQKDTSDAQPEVKFYDYCFRCQHAFPASQTTTEIQRKENSMAAAFRAYSASSVECGEEHAGDPAKTNAFPLGQIFLTSDFITAAEEQELMKQIDERFWVPSQSGRRKQDYGPKVNFKRRKVQLVKEFCGLPDYSSSLLCRMLTHPQLRDFQCVELCNLEYVPERASSIDAHIDDEWLWGERLVTINLGDDTYLTLSPLQPKAFFPIPAVRVALPRRSLFVMAGEARHQWQHAIHPEDIHSRRIAMTFRELSAEFLTGAQSDMGRAILRTAQSFTGDVVRSHPDRVLPTPSLSLHGEKSEPEESFRVLSIQSHVVSGYVGNRAAVFPLQLLGFDVDVINTVQFSNHTAYPVVGGTTLEASQLADIFAGLFANNLAETYTHLLTGFIPNQQLLQQVAVMAKKLKELNPSLVYVCDPVMGDEGQLYVAQEVLQVYKEEILPLVDIVTPNQFEMELLTGMKIGSEKEALQAMKLLYRKYKSDMTVVISSSQVSPGSLSAFGCDSESSLPFTIQVPRIDAYFTGAGDLFAALLLAWIARTKDVGLACQRSMSTLQAVLQRTLLHHQQNCPDKDSKPCFRHMELRLIQSKHDILSPKALSPFSA
ncbi:hypothetical protein RvY_03236 [Ramazzottius varieornatus]|uniref:Pyridoxal kinase n=1 Tax=Ramazzottius varieornatus TaxID=947166 RepID=A0A1D1UXJ0_RAMVA|nr:hypothetical protein RvY_03236 [Ramazzottius varieornatus]